MFTPFVHHNVLSVWAASATSSEVTVAEDLKGSNLPSDIDSQSRFIIFFVLTEGDNAIW